LWARSNATKAADSSCVGWRGGGGALTWRVAGLRALTAAIFCVFLTLETAVFLDVAFLLAGFEVGFRLFAARLGGAAFFAGRTLTVAFTAVFRAGAFGTVALLALGLEAVFALTARFAALDEVRFAAVLAVDLRKPFERLLLILVLIYKGCPDSLSSRRIGAQLSIG
jgi:hypothetical protein